MRRLPDPDTAVRLLPPGARVLATPACATPETLLAALGRSADESPGRTLVTGLLLGSMAFLDAVRAGSLGLRTWHASGGSRRLIDAGRADYVPMRLGDVPGALPGMVDAMILRVSPPDRAGRASIGPSGSYTMAGLRAVRAAGGVVLAEIDPELPWTSGPTVLDLDDCTAVVEADTPTCLYPPAERLDAHRRIGELVAGLLPLAATVQLGVGAVPEAITDALGGVGGVRLVGLASDGVIGLLAGGGLRRGDGPPVTAVEVMGSAALMRFVDRNADIEVVSSETAHHPRWIGAHHRFVSVNSALEVDLSGQVALEAAGGRTIAGLGGAVDFFEGAHLSAGGLRVVALRSTDADGTGSKIVANLAGGTPASIPRHAVDVVVTEHGVAHLAGRSIAERAEALVAIAAPAARDALADAHAGSSGR